MKALTVRYFASLRELVGHERETLLIPESGLTLSELIELLSDVHSAEVAEALVGPGVRLALNDELVDGEPELVQPGDVVAFLPPVTGG